MGFVDRQTQNLKLIVAAQKKNYPRELMEETDAQEVYVELHSERCLRCGSKVAAAVTATGPQFCEQCVGEFMTYDKQIAPQAGWWGDLVNKLSHRA